MRLASGIAPVRAMRDAGVKVGLGVDGSASNDGNHMLGEARQAMLLQRVGGDPAGLTARQALELATLGGASALRRDDIGSIEPGKAADLIAINLNRLGYAGALHDPVAAVIFCTPTNVDWSMIDGKVVVQDRHIATLEIEPVIERHNRIAHKMIDGD
jgi:cytosine/adenosine deaminase-related metal-dependent hydrolase